ncbi:MAG: PadR family transcriptional regulator [Leptolyngbya sp. SIO1E4]|nr:PadR family transcriptional regulator [Leptolyngbya sp. SIO1E4]
MIIYPTKIMNNVTTVKLSRLMTAEEMILRSLLHGSSYGAEISEKISFATEKWLPPGTLYPKLQMLREEGLIEQISKLETSLGERDGRPRKYYKLTAKGRMALSESDECRNRLSQPDLSGWQPC